MHKEEIKAHQIPLLAGKYLYNKPLLTTESQLSEIVSYVESRNEPQFAISREIAAKATEGYYGEGDIGVIPISGALTYERTMFEAVCGGMSYETLLMTVREAISQGYTTLVYDVDSGGGQAYGCFETALQVRELTRQAGIKTITYVDGAAGSAAYALSVMADEIIANPMAEVGSVGVVTKLRNTSEKDKKEGVKNVYVYAGDSKIPFDADGDFTESFLEDLQERADSLYEDFLDHVATLRGIEKETVRSTQAKMLTAEKALDIGFVDQVMTRSDFAEYLADIQDKGDNMPIKSLKLNKEDKQDMSKENVNTALEDAIAEKKTALSQLTEANETIAKLEEQLSAVSAELESANSELTELKDEVHQKELNARKEKLSSILAEDKVESVFEATKDLPEAAFNAVCGGYEAQSAALEQTEMFNETGIDAEGENTLQTTVGEKSSSVMQFIKDKKASK